MLHDAAEFDVIIIGAGVAGCCIARELARYDLRIGVLEAGNDVAFATSRANSGIVHAGYDPTPGSLKAQYCAAGARLYAKWAEELEFGFHETGSMVLAFTDAEKETLRLLQERAMQNAVTVQLLGPEEIHEREPHVSDAVLAALYAPHAGICDPYGITFAAAENAAENGVEFLFNEEVTGLYTRDGGFSLFTASGAMFYSTLVVNAAGVFADVLNNMVSEHALDITPVRGEYLLYDTPYGSLFSHVLFQAPGELGKGVLITPTIHGNLLIGPNALVQKSKSAVSTSAEGLENVLARAQRTWPKASLEGVITNFAGLRAKGKSGDFVIGEAEDVPGFYNIACFESPGLTAAPAVAKDLAKELGAVLCADKKASFNPRRKRSGHKLFALMSPSEQEAAVALDPTEGELVCRCCNVTKADLLFELDATLPVLSMDSLKWRTGITMGRCHGGFCAPELMNIIYEHTGIVPEEQDKRLPESPFVVSNSSSYAHGVCDPLSSGAPGESVSQASTEEQALQEAAELQVSAFPCFDVLVIGAGAAGMAAAEAALDEGAKRVALLDREGFLGGILRQCIHNGFGLTRFKKELTGPEYASKEAAKLGVTEGQVPRHTACVTGGQSYRPLVTPEGLDLFLHATVLQILPAKTPQGLHTVSVASPDGLLRLQTKAVVLATGSRERGQGALNLAGSRPAGVFSAGSAQNLINLKGCLPGRKVVIQGSGDIGLIMARRCLFSGAEVLGVFARSSKPSGLRRNVRQCLDDFGIPFFGNSLVTRLEGSGRLQAVWISKVDPTTKQIIEGSEERLACDTLLLSIGLIPESELAIAAGIALDERTGSPRVNTWLETSAPGIFVCGNSLHIHDLADSASDEGGRAGRCAARHALGLPKQGNAEKKSFDQSTQALLTEEAEADCAAKDPSVAGVVVADGAGAGNEPLGSGGAEAEAIHSDASLVLGAEQRLSSPPSLELTCVRCPKGCELSVWLAEDGSVAQVAGEGCKLGLDYAEEEVTAPKRIVTASLPVAGTLEPVSVKTSKPVPRELIFAVLEEANGLALHTPVAEGALLIEDVAGTGASLLATKTV